MSADPEIRTLRTLIADDEPLAVERMQIICAGIPALAVVGTANDGAAALRLIEALTPDLVLLDMTMPELDGLGVARRLGGKANAPAIVFVTAHDSFAVEAFDLDAVDMCSSQSPPNGLSEQSGGHWRGGGREARARPATGSPSSGFRIAPNCCGSRLTT